MKYLIYSFLRSGVEAKRGVDIRHSTCNVSRIQRKVEDEYFNTKLPLPILLHAGYRVKLKNYKQIFSEASCGAAARGVTVKPTGCGFDPHSRR